MVIVKKSLLIVFLLIVGGFCAWVLRGEYDKRFMMEGRFHVVSTSQQDHEVALTFPSGAQVDFTLKKSASFNFKQTDTGEGSIAVSIDGVDREPVGYVTSMNNIVVLTMDEEHVGFSQIFYKIFPR